MLTEKCFKIRAAVMLMGSFFMIPRSSGYSPCPNQCSGQGVCVTNTTTPGFCNCFPGFHGFDCSIRVCASGKAWADFPYADNNAHADFTECSNMGVCDRSTGLCTCRFGFTGAACEMMLCPMGKDAVAFAINQPAYIPCNGRGRCMSLREVSVYQDWVNYNNYTSYVDWDADMIHGCVCDPGFEGLSCEKQSCPRGDDPMTYGIDDVQLLDCKCYNCTGSVQLTFRGKTVPSIPYDASATLVKYQLKRFTGIEELNVDIVHGVGLCSHSGSVTEFTFKLPQGKQPPMTVKNIGGLNVSLLAIRYSGASSTISTSYVSVTGTKEYVECSNRGLCNYATGSCDCYDGFMSSNGRGDKGTRGDCGYRYTHEAITYYMNSTESVTTTCPFYNGGICSDHGSCNETTGVCSCYSGYGGSNCANQTCETTNTWFGDTGVGHFGMSVCGGVGVCDGNTGNCTNCGGEWGLYEGEKCQYLSCVRDSDGNTCSGNGTCMSLRQMASYAYNEQKELSGVVYDTPWDADMIRGCACYRSPSVDNEYDSTYVNDIGTFLMHYQNYSYGNGTELWKQQFYRGPYAWAVSDFTGYGCTYSGCPKGDNPLTRGQLNEIQKIWCKAGNGTFRLTFRENTTLPIPYNASATLLKERLEQLFTIREVSVSIIGDNNNTVCTPYGNAHTYVEFTTEFGDLPLIKLASSDLTDLGSTGVHNYAGFNITQYQQGTKEDMECSGTGICQEESGICNCLEGFASSNGSYYAAGSKGDCSFNNIFGRF